MIGASWRQHKGQVCRGVSWSSYPLHVLQLVGACLGGVGLAAILNVLCANHRHFSGGMPDLLLWRSRPIAGTDGGGSDGAGTGAAGTLQEAGSSSTVADPTASTPFAGAATAASALGGGDEAGGGRLYKQQVVSPEEQVDIVLDTKRFVFEAKFVEVKGPRDRLSDKQRVWIAALLAGGVDVEVCRVVETRAQLLRRGATTGAR